MLNKPQVRQKITHLVDQLNGVLLEARDVGLECQGTFELVYNPLEGKHLEVKIQMYNSLGEQYGFKEDKGDKE